MAKEMDIRSILDKVSKKSGTAPSKVEEADEGEDPSKVAAEAQVEKFFSKGNSGDFAAATSALAAAVRLCGRMGSDDGDEE